MNEDEKFVAEANLVKGHIDSIVTVATAVLVLSVTLLKDAEIKDPVNNLLLKGSWVLFTIVIIAGIAHNFSLMRLLTDHRCWAANSCTKKRGFNTAMVIVTHIGFPFAVIVLLTFAWLNLK